jgi:hypothetical protein
MSGHTLVRSRFEIHPSCALWISSFIQVHGAHPHSPGTQRDPIGTPSEPEKGRGSNPTDTLRWAQKRTDSSR